MVLRPYAITTVRMEPPWEFVISRPGREIKPADLVAAIRALEWAWRGELLDLSVSDPVQFDQAISLINGQAVTEARAYRAYAD